MEWLKTLYISIFTYGLRQLNNIVVNALTIFLNNYGNRLFKMDTDIIKNTECIDDVDIFYLYPIQTGTNITHTINCNLVTLKSGIIDGITISFPWQTLLSTKTIIQLDKIELDIITEKASSQLTKSVYSIGNNIDEVDIENNDIVHAYNEINYLIMQYFKSVSVEIKKININLDKLNTCITNIIYCDKKLSIETIQIGETILKKLTYDITQSQITIKNIIINENTIHLLPEIYDDGVKSSNDKNINIINVRIMNLQIGKLSLRNIDLTISPNELTIYNLEELIIKNAIKISSKNINNYVLMYNISENTILCDAIISLKPDNVELINYKKLTKQFNYFNRLFDLILSKRVYLFKQNTQSKKNIIIKNMKINYFHLDNYFDVNTTELIINKTTLSLIEFTIFDITSNVLLSCTNILCDYANYSLQINYLTSKTDLFCVLADNIYIIKINNEIEINLTNMNVFKSSEMSNYMRKIIELININTIEKKESKKEILTSSLASSLASSLPNDNCDLNMSQITIPSTRPEIKINICGTKFNIVQDKYNFVLEIKNGCVHFLDRIGTAIDLNVYMDEYFISTLSIDYVDYESIRINDCKFFMDPEIFDKLNYLFGTLMPNSENDPVVQRSQMILSQSISTKSIIELEKTINDEILKTSIKYDVDPDKPIIKMLLNSISDLHKIMVNDMITDYCYVDNKKYDLKVHVKLPTIYLFDILTKNIPLSQAFLCITLNDIEFTKLSTMNETTSTPSIKYIFKIFKGYAIDTSSTETQWQYFFKSENDTPLINVNITTYEDIYDIKIILGPIIANIREETFLRLLGFFSNSHQLPSQGKKSTAFISTFNMSDMNITINYFPLILKDTNTSCADMLFLRDFKIKLQQQNFKNKNGFNVLLSQITTKWSADIDIKNLLQFIPHLNAIKPCTSGFSRLVKMINRYFESNQNRRMLRDISKNISGKVDYITSIVKMGYTQFISLLLVQSEENINTLKENTSDNKYQLSTNLQNGNLNVL